MDGKRNHIFYETTLKLNKYFHRKSSKYFVKIFNLFFVKIYEFLKNLRLHLNLRIYVKCIFDLVTLYCNLRWYPPSNSLGGLAYTVAFLGKYVRLYVRL